MRRFGHAALVVLALLASRSVGDYEQQLQLGNVSARLHLEGPAADSADVRLSGEILSLTVEGPSSMEVVPADPWTRSVGWRVSHAWKATGTYLSSGRIRWEQRVRLEPVKPGDTMLELEPIVVRETSGLEHRIEFPPIALRVITSVKSVDLSALRDVPGLEQLPATGESRFWWWILGIAGSLVTLAAVAAMVANRWRRTTAVPPQVWAETELNALQVLAHEHPHALREHFKLLADLLRRYLELTSGIPALELTTPELTTRLQAGIGIQADQQAMLFSILEGCDPVKFAGVQPGLMELDAQFAKARSFIQAAAGGHAPSQNRDPAAQDRRQPE